MPCERIFLSIGHRLADDLAVQLGCERDEDGMIEVDRAFHTSVRNVFAAGDIVPGPHLGIVAAAHGAIAAAAINRSTPAGEPQAVAAPNAPTGGWRTP